MRTDRDTQYDSLVATWLENERQEHELTKQALARALEDMEERDQIIRDLTDANHRLRILVTTTPEQALASALAEVERLKAEKSDLIYVLKECVNYLKGERPSSPQLLSYCQRLLDREEKQ